MRVFFLLLWTACFVVAQVALAEPISLGRCAPDFLALLPVFVAMYASRGEAVAIGALTGLVIDMLASARLGPMAVSLAFVYWYFGPRQADLSQLQSELELKEVSLTDSTLPVSTCWRCLIKVSVRATTRVIGPLSHIAVSIEWASRSPVTPDPATLASSRQSAAPPRGTSSAIVQS